VNIRTKHGVALLVTLSGAACAGGAQRPGGPAPEYERPSVPAWDAGKSVDPLERAEALGEPVDEPATDPDAAVRADAAAPDSKAP
jgi:hypothetical protein